MVPSFVPREAEVERSEPLTWAWFVDEVGGVLGNNIIHPLRTFIFCMWLYRKPHVTWKILFTLFRFSALQVITYTFVNSSSIEIKIISIFEHIVEIIIPLLLHMCFWCSLYSLTTIAIHSC